MYCAHTRTHILIKETEKYRKSNHCFRDFIPIFLLLFGEFEAWTPHRFCFLLLSLLSTVPRPIPSHYLEYLKQIVHRNNITPLSTRHTHTHPMLVTKRREKLNWETKEMANDNQTSPRSHSFHQTHTHPTSMRKHLLQTHLIWETRILKVIVGEQYKTQKIRNDGTGTFIYYIILYSCRILCVCVCTDFCVFVPSK